MRRVTRAAASLLLGLALAAVPGAATAAPSVASSPLTITYVHCEQVLGFWHDAVFCTAQASGGVAPYTYVWTNQSYPFNWRPVSGQDAYIECIRGTLPTVTLRVTDSVGQTADSWGWARCLGPGDQID